MVVKAIIFDVGGVLVNESGSLPRNFIANKYGFNTEDFWNYAKKNLNKSYKGELDAEDFFKGLVDELGLDIDSSVLVDDWLFAREKFSSIDPVVKETVENLGKNYLVGTLTNSTCLNDRVSSRKDSYGLFKLNIISCDVGAVKPEGEIYEILLKELKTYGIKSDEVVFVDDREENLVIARDFGIKTVLFKDSEQMINDLRLEGVEI